MPTNKTGWENTRREHFNEIVTEYDKVRPYYPEDLFNDIFLYCQHNNDNKKAIEIGAGTGKATTPFLNANYDVTAVELSKNMSEFLSKKFATYKNFKVITSSFEDAELEGDCYDLIYAASAFHWVNAEIGCPKAFNLLKKDGTIALFRYNLIANDGDELYEEIQSYYEKYYYSYYTSNSKPVKKSKEDFLKPSEIYVGYRFEDLKVYGFGDIEMKFYDVQNEYNSENFIAFLDTLSDHRALPDENRLALYEKVKNAILNHRNSHKLNFIFQLYMGRK